MDLFIEHYKVKKKGELFCLNDIATNIMKTNHQAIYMAKIAEKTKIDNMYYISEEKFKSIIQNARSEYGKKAFATLSLMLNDNTQKDNSKILNKKEKNNENIKIKQTHLSRNQYIKFDGENIHVIIINDDYWFKGTEICKVLEYEKERDAINNLVDNQNKMYLTDILKVYRTAPFTGGSINISNNTKPHTIYINYSGLYELCLLSKKSKAKEFRRWIVNEVIPSIEKTGTYTLPENKKIPLPIPLSKKEVDLNDHINSSCVYIIHIKDNLFKFGWSDNIIERVNRHKTNYKYTKISDVFQLDSINECLIIEGKIKIFCRQQKIMCSGERQKIILNKKTLKASYEMFETTENTTIDTVINKIKMYITDLQNEKKKQQILDGKRLVADEFLLNDSISDEIKLKRLEIEFELRKLEILNNANVQKNNTDNFHNQIEIVESINNLQDTQCNNSQEKSNKSIIKMLDNNNLSEISDSDNESIFSYNNEHDKNIQINKKEKKSVTKKPQKKTHKPTKTQNNISNNNSINIPKSKYAHNKNQQFNVQQIQADDKLCEKCNNIINKKKNYCTFCPGLKKVLESVKNSNRPSFNTLKQEIEKTSVCEVARKYNVSDNCIRKWLKSYVKFGLAELVTN